jgi:hypothetical protein
MLLQGKIVRNLLIGMTLLNVLLIGFFFYASAKWPWLLGDLFPGKFGPGLSPEFTGNYVVLSLLLLINAIVITLVGFKDTLHAMWAGMRLSPKTMRRFLNEKAGLAADISGVVAAAVVLLASFVLIEARSREALMPLRIFRNRNRSGAYLIMLCVGTALFGMFFFLTLFVQGVWGYSALKTGVAYLPMVAMIMAMAGVSTQLVPRIGARPLLLAASAITTGGMFWLSRINEHSTYVGGLLGPMLVTAAGLGMLFMPATLVALSKVDDKDAGLASSLVNTGQQVGGAIGLAILGTVAWSAVANSIHSQAAAAAAAAKHAAVHLSVAQQAAAQKAITAHAYSVGFSKGYLVSAGIALLALIITVVAIRVKREDLAGVNPMAAPTD